MKKSTLSITLGIAGILVLIIVANLKLSAEYKKGNIRSGMAAIQLPAYHHIKEIRSNFADRFGGIITLIQHKDSSALLYNYYGSPDILYSVKNDTLFLEPEKNDKNFNYHPIIYYQNLQSIECANSHITMLYGKFDNLSIYASDYGNVNLFKTTLQKIRVNAIQNSSITLSTNDTIRSAEILLQDNATFNAKHTCFLTKNIKMGANTTFSFSGIKADQFGLNRVLLMK